MRLTLRTLLAYVDDILEPAQAREIGVKISESGFATALMNRIRDVMRRRRLTSPDLEGPGSGIDPNLVSEYLDNVLPPEKVPDVEKVCLESDVHLAEVAACHQILTAALGEPVQILPESREHMYALGPVGKSAAGIPDEAISHPQPIAETRAALAANGHGKPGEAAQTQPETESDFANAIPDYLRQRPLWKRLLPFAVVAAVAAAWIGLLKWDDWRGGPADARTVVAQRDAGAGINENATAELPGGDEFGGEPETVEGTVKKVEPAGEALPLDGESIDPPPPADEAAGGQPVVDARPPGDLVLPPAPAGANPVPADNPPPNAPNEVAAAPAAQPDAAPPDPRPLPAGPEIQYASPTGILLRYDNGVKDWMVMAPRAMVHPEEQFAAPEPFDAKLDIGDDLARATLKGGTLVAILPPTQAASTGFAIEQGRLALQRLKPAAVADDAQGEAGQAAPQPVVLALAVRQKLWRLELLTPDTVCGVEVHPVQPNRFEQDLGAGTWTGRLIVASGSVRLASADGQVELISGPSVRPLSPVAAKKVEAVQEEAEQEEQGAAGNVEAGNEAAANDVPADEADADEPPNNVATVRPLSHVPDWLNPAAEPTYGLTVRRSAKLFEDQFNLERPLYENVHQLIKDEQPYVSMLAVKCLALVGDYVAMVEGLNAAHEEARLAAINGLRDWLGQDPRNGELLKQALGKYFATDEAEIVYRLLWGYNETDARDRATSAQLVAWLDHNSVIVRELAFHHIYALTGIKYGYLPLRPAAQRQSSIIRWQERISNEGGLIPAED